MVFGYLVNGQLQGTMAGNYTLIIGGGDGGQEMNDLQVRLPSLPLMIQSSIFALSGMPVIIFFSFFVSILYYYGIMQIIVNKFGKILQITIGTTACESISASGNIFLGMVISFCSKITQITQKSHLNFHFLFFNPIIIFKKV